MTRSEKFGSCLLLALVCIVPQLAIAQVTKQVTIPTEDRFVPFALTIHIGDSVQWTNNDTDNHTIVAVQQLTTSDHKTVNHVILGTDANGGHPGTYVLTFHQPGRFLYHCRFHSTVDSHHQPIAPGPKGGIQDSKGNYGTPMMGVITVEVP